MSIVEEKGFKILGISMVTTTDHEVSHAAFEEIWDRFFKDDIMNKVPNKVEPTVYSIYDQYKETAPGVYDFRVTIGCKSTNDTDTDDLTLAEVKAGQYQQFPVKGKMPDAIIQKWEDIWKEGPAIRRQFDTDYEAYGPKSYDKENGEMDIFLSVAG